MGRLHKRSCNYYHKLAISYLTNLSQFSYFHKSNLPSYVPDLKFWPVLKKTNLIQMLLRWSNKKRIGHLSHCRFWWRGPAWWLANQLPFDVTTMPQQSCSVGVRWPDPRQSLRSLDYVIGKSMKDNKDKKTYIKCRRRHFKHRHLTDCNKTE